MASHKLTGVLAPNECTMVIWRGGTADAEVMAATAYNVRRERLRHLDAGSTRVTIA